jgi:hypothetical protein
MGQWLALLIAIRETALHLHRMGQWLALFIARVLSVNIWSHVTN